MIKLIPFDGHFLRGRLGSEGRGFISGIPRSPLFGRPPTSTTPCTTRVTRRRGCRTRWYPSLGSAFSSGSSKLPGLPSCGISSSSGKKSVRACSPWAGGDVTSDLLRWRGVAADLREGLVGSEVCTFGLPSRRSMSRLCLPIALWSLL